MNCTNQITEAAKAPTVGPEATQSWSDWLPGEIRSRRLPVESDATPAEVIPWVHKLLKRHVELEIPEGYESHKPWKATLDDWNQFLTRLHDAEKQIFAQNSARNSELLPDQRDPKCTESARKCTAGARPETNGAQQETTRAQECASSGQSISTDAPIDSEQSEQPNILQDEDDDNHDEDLDDTENDEDEDNDDDVGYDDEDDDDAQLEADMEAELAGFDDDAHCMTEAAEDLKAELTGRNRFDRLTATQQAAIVVMLDSHHSLATVVRIIAKPSPKGLNFKISKSGLAKFAKRYKAREQERRKLQNAQASADLLDKSEDPDQAFQTAFERLLRLRLLTASSEPDAPLETIDALTSILTKLRKQSLAERKQLHAEKSK